MSIESLEKAFLARLVNGQVVQDPKPTWEDINGWTVRERATAVANGIVGYSSSIRAYQELKNTEGVDRLLKNLRDNGWKGINLEDFNRDLMLIKQHYRSILSKSWDGYFGK